MLQSYTFSNLADERSIRDYVERQARGEIVQHAEKIKVNQLFDRSYDCWDVYTQRDRYWVITSPTNLYSQRYFPSLDYTLSFHIGVVARLLARRDGPPDDAHRLRMIPVWRRWEEAADALNTAEEAEEFQAIGMRCRECLIQLIRLLGNQEMIPLGQEPPLRADVIGWCEHIANSVAHGAGAEHIRGHLKTSAKSTWQLANWLTHTGSAGRSDAAFVLDATQTVIAAFGSAAMRSESGSPNRCPKCGSYSITVGYNPENTPPYISTCDKCEWSSSREAEIASTRD